MKPDGLWISLGAVFHRFDCTRSRAVDSDVWVEIGELTREDDES